MLSKRISIKPSPLISIPVAPASQTNHLYHVEGQYNFSEHIKLFELVVGANYRSYHLNSNGTIFVDSAGTIKIDEYGGYVQVAKKLFNDVLKLTASGRYDKSKNFDGRFTPRVTATDPGGQRQ